MRVNVQSRLTLAFIVVEGGDEREILKRLRCSVESPSLPLLLELEWEIHGGIGEFDELGVEQ